MIFMTLLTLMIPIGNSHRVRARSMARPPYPTPRPPDHSRRVRHKLSRVQRMCARNPARPKIHGSCGPRIAPVVCGISHPVSNGCAPGTRRSRRSADHENSAGIHPRLPCAQWFPFPVDPMDSLLTGMIHTPTTLQPPAAVPTSRPMRIFLRFGHPLATAQRSTAKSPGDPAYTPGRPPKSSRLG